MSSARPTPHQRYQKRCRPGRSAPSVQRRQLALERPDSSPRSRARCRSLSAWIRSKLFRRPGSVWLQLAPCRALRVHHALRALLRRLRLAQLRGRLARQQLGRHPNSPSRLQFPILKESLAQTTRRRMKTDRGRTHQELSLRPHRCDACLGASWSETALALQCLRIGSHSRARDPNTVRCSPGSPSATAPSGPRLRLSHCAALFASLVRRPISP
mmetsp:Transcript_14649/g.44001  ORF Transcript_14649/g.44001 Transcript_14649/m.44001 type:complete len:214 (+) Transcript_14649:971-1612(+)